MRDKLFSAFDKKELFIYLATAKIIPEIRI